MADQTFPGPAVSISGLHHAENYPAGEGIERADGVYAEFEVTGEVY